MIPERTAPLNQRRACRRPITPLPSARIMPDTSRDAHAVRRPGVPSGVAVTVIQTPLGVFHTVYFIGVFHTENSEWN